MNENKSISLGPPWVTACGPQPRGYTGEGSSRGQAMKTPQLSRMGKIWKSPGWNDPGYWKFSLALCLSPDPALSHWTTLSKRVLL